MIDWPTFPRVCAQVAIAAVLLLAFIAALFAITDWLYR